MDRATAWAALRWLLTPIAAVAAGCAGIVLFAGLSMGSGSLLANWSPWVMGDFMQAMAVFAAGLAGACTAPAARLRVALGIGVAAVVLSKLLTPSDTPLTLAGAALGGALALGWVYLRERWQDRPALRMSWIGGVAAFLAAAAAAYGTECYFDFSPRARGPYRSFWPRPYFDSSLMRLPEVWRSFYTYNLDNWPGGERVLFRFRASREQAEVLAGELGLLPVARLPEQFWDQPPQWWPARAPDGAVLFGTPDFPVEGDGPEGQHFLLAYNPAEATGYLWMKSFY